MNDQIILAESFFRLQYYASHYQLAPLRIGYSKHRRFTNRRMLVDNCFDLAALDILSAGYNHVLQAVQDVYVPIGILIADVAGPKQPVSERTCSFFRIIPITAHDIRTPSHQFTSAPGVDLFS